MNEQAIKGYEIAINTRKKALPSFDFWIKELEIMKENIEVILSTNVRKLLKVIKDEPKNFRDYVKQMNDHHQKNKDLWIESEVFKVDLQIQQKKGEKNQILKEITEMRLAIDKLKEDKNGKKV